MNSSSSKSLSSHSIASQGGPYSAIISPRAAQQAVSNGHPHQHYPWPHNPLLSAELQSLESARGGSISYSSAESRPQAYLPYHVRYQPSSYPQDLSQQPRRSDAIIENNYNPQQQQQQQRVSRVRLGLERVLAVLGDVFWGLGFMLLTIAGFFKVLQPHRSDQYEYHYVGNALIISAACLFVLGGLSFFIQRTSRWLRKDTAAARPRVRMLFRLELLMGLFFIFGAAGLMVWAPRGVATSGTSNLGWAIVGLVGQVLILDTTIVRAIRNALGSPTTKRSKLFVQRFALLGTFFFFFGNCVLVLAFIGAMVMATVVDAASSGFYTLTFVCVIVGALFNVFGYLVQFFLDFQALKRQ